MRTRNSPGRSATAKSSGGSTTRSSPRKQGSVSKPTAPRPPAGKSVAIVRSSQQQQQSQQVQQVQQEASSTIVVADGLTHAVVTDGHIPQAVVDGNISQAIPVIDVSQTVTQNGVTYQPWTVVATTAGDPLQSHSVSGGLPSTITHLITIHPDQVLQHQLANSTAPSQQKTVKTTACPVEGCGQHIPTKRFRDHMRRHRGEKPFACRFPGCGKAFSRSDFLKKHNRVHLKPQMPKPHRCSLCPTDKGFATHSSFLSHMREKHPSEYASQQAEKEANFVRKVPARVCDVCHKEINTSSFGLHMRRHRGERRYPCSHAGCQKAFYTPRELKAHSKTHSRTRPVKEFPCPHCEKSFSQKDKLRGHVKTCHAEEFAIQEFLNSLNVTVQQQQPTVTPIVPPSEQLAGDQPLVTSLHPPSVTASEQERRERIQHCDIKGCSCHTKRCHMFFRQSGELRDKWTDALKEAFGDDMSPYRSLNVCMCHFDLGDIYIRPKEGRLRLMKRALPKAVTNSWQEIQSLDEDGLRKKLQEKLWELHFIRKKFNFTEDIRKPQSTPISIPLANGDIEPPTETEAEESETESRRDRREGPSTQEQKDQPVKKQKKRERDRKCDIKDCSCDTSVCHVHRRHTGESREAWVTAVKEAFGQEIVKREVAICRCHFDPHDYTTEGGKLKISKDALPKPTKVPPPEDRKILETNISYEELKKKYFETKKRFDRFKSSVEKVCSNDQLMKLGFDPDALPLPKEPKKPKFLSLEEKYQIIRAVEVEKVDRKTLMSQYDISKCTMSQLLRHHRNKIVEDYDEKYNNGVPSLPRRTPEENGSSIDGSSTN